MPDFSQTTDTVSSTHWELQEPSARYQDENNCNGIMTSSLYSGFGFSQRASQRASFSLPDKFAVIFFFSCVIFTGRNFFAPAISYNRLWDVSIITLKPRTFADRLHMFAPQSASFQLPFIGKHKNTSRRTNTSGAISSAYCSLN